MKHVFVINSHTTFLTSMGTVDYLRLRDKDVIFLYKRNYRNQVTPVPFKVVEATEIANASRNVVVDYEGTVRKVDEFINQNIHDNYYLYVPHLWHFFFQLLYTNHKCRRVSYVQEGGPAQAGVYENDVPISERFRLFIRHAIFGRRIFECKWYKKGTLYKQCSVDSYAINDKYFQYLPSRNHIVKWPVQKLQMTIDSRWPIFIFDGHVKNGLVESNIYLQACKEIISQYGREHNYVKFHPAQNQEERESILTFFAESGHSVEPMTDNIPMEYVIMQFKNLSFIGFTSSLLYYAHDNGHHLVCCEKKLTAMSERYLEHVKTNGFQTYAQTYGE